MTQLNGLPKARKIIIETHDLKFVLASKVTKSSPTSMRMLLKLRNEVSCLNSANALIAISPPEKAIYQLLTENYNIFYIPVYSLHGKIEEFYTDENGFKADILFLASGSRFNVEGFREFLVANSSWLRNYRICLAGLICKNAQIISLSHTFGNISLLGYVNNPSEAYRVAKAVISPTDGTGIKIKVLEALLHGKPVFGSDHTRAGLPGKYEGCVLPLDRATIEAVLNDPGSRRSAETAAYNYISTLYQHSEAKLLLNYLQSNQ
jgi:glycosyltransferase involved in cell wall biosynthesis